MTDVTQVPPRARPWRPGAWFGPESYTAPLAAWVWFVAAAELLPPNHLPIIHIKHIDKLEHGTCYLVLGWLFARAWVRKGEARPGALLTVWSICAAWGFYMEVMQGFSGYRDFELTDELANAIGVAIGLGLWLLWRRGGRRQLLKNEAGANP